MPDAPEEIDVPVGDDVMRVFVYGQSTAPGRPLVVVSHGTGSTPRLYRHTAGHLAEIGFTVAVLEHPGNHLGDNRLAGTAAILRNRPIHLRAAVDRLAGDDTPVFVIGHSLGGYTALAAAGGRPRTLASESATPEDVAVQADPRIRALVLLAPATPWFAHPGALSAVTVPILMMSAGRDPFTPPWHADIVRSGVESNVVVHRHIEKAGHFSFQSPWPPHLRSPDVLPSQDPEGFDREGFAPVMNADIAEFLQSRLAAPG